MRDRQPKTLIFWGQNDIFFTQEGGEAYLKDLPNAEMHRLESGHFAVEDCLVEITSNIRRFYLDRVVEIPLDNNAKTLGTIYVNTPLNVLGNIHSL